MCTCGCLFLCASVNILYTVCGLYTVCFSVFLLVCVLVNVSCVCPDMRIVKVKGVYVHGNNMSTYYSIYCSTYVDISTMYRHIRL